MTTPNVPYRFEVELTVSGSPEQVWQAIATAEGISGWMMSTELEPREGGAMRFEMGPDMESVGKVTAYEPSRRFVYEEDWARLVGQPADSVSPMATEFLIEAQSGGTCVVRVVTSAYGTGADWENEFWVDMGTGWAPMLDNLRIYMSHFAGQSVTSTQSTVALAGTAEGAIDRARAALGVQSVGDRVHALGADAVVERIIPRHFLLRLEQPVPGLMSFYSWGAEDGSSLTVGTYLYGDRGAAEAEQTQKQWQAWLDDLVSNTTETATS